MAKIRRERFTASDLGGVILPSDYDDAYHRSLTAFRRKFGKKVVALCDTTENADWLAPVRKKEE